MAEIAQYGRQLTRNNRMRSCHKAVLHRLTYLVGKINEPTIVGGGCGLPKAHVDQISLVLQDRYQSPRQASSSFHSAQAGVANLA